MVRVKETCNEKHSEIPYIYCWLEKDHERAQHECPDGKGDYICWATFEKALSTSWCHRPTTFTVNGSPHVVPCGLSEGHEGDCVPDHDVRHFCDVNGCSII